MSCRKWLCMLITPSRTAARRACPKFANPPARYGRSFYCTARPCPDEGEACSSTTAVYPSSLAAALMADGQVVVWLFAGPASWKRKDVRWCWHGVKWIAVFFIWLHRRRDSRSAHLRRLPGRARLLITTTRRPSSTTMRSRPGWWTTIWWEAILSHHTADNVGPQAGAAGAPGATLLPTAAEAEIIPRRR